MISYRMSDPSGTCGCRPFVQKPNNFETNLGDLETDHFRALGAPCPAQHIGKVDTAVSQGRIRDPWNNEAPRRRPGPENKPLAERPEQRAAAFATEHTFSAITHQCPRNRPQSYPTTIGQIALQPIHKHNGSSEICVSTNRIYGWLNSISPVLCLWGCGGAAIPLV